ncbi:MULTISPECIES: hypothetical protein [unclassified Microcoleus]|uniref:hypothetical protein n=1 Tax=unclassified Microcoleus TaxID=2642155 RepID=UPI002FD6D241
MSGYLTLLLLGIWAGKPSKKIGADWAIIFDTGDRIHRQVNSIRDGSDRLGGDIFLVGESHRSYCK